MLIIQGSASQNFLADPGVTLSVAPVQRYETNPPEMKPKRGLSGRDLNSVA